MKVREKLAEIRAQIRALEQRYQRNKGEINLLAVSKTRSVEEIMTAIDAGQLQFGENYCQEAIEKIKLINNPEITWHFIGPVQSNKTQTIATYFDWVHTVDRLKIARRLNQARPASRPPLNICVQVNISREKTKSGIDIDDVADFLNELKMFSRLVVRGLMTLPAPAYNLQQQRRPFAGLKAQLQALKQEHTDLDTLSAGTSRDLEAAIAEGATMVRIGTAIFGPRHASH